MASTRSDVIPFFTFSERESLSSMSLLVGDSPTLAVTRLLQYLRLPSSPPLRGQHRRKAAAMPPLPLRPPLPPRHSLRNGLYRLPSRPKRPLSPLGLQRTLQKLPKRFLRLQRVSQKLPKRSLRHRLSPRRPRRSPFRSLLRRRWWRRLLQNLRQPRRRPPNGPSTG